MKITIEFVDTIKNILRLPLDKLVIDDTNGLCCQIADHFERSNWYIKYNETSCWYDSAEFIEIVIDFIIKDWKHYSGESNYPVPGGMDAYYDDEEKWVGKPLDYRLDLIGFIIENIDKAIGEELEEP